MTDLIKQNEMIIYYQPSGDGTAFKPYGVGKNAGGITGKSVPGTETSPVYGRTELGTPTVITQNLEAPGDLPGATITVYEQGQVDFLLSALQKGCPINIQNRMYSCGVLTNPVAWTSLEHWGGGVVTGYSPGDGPSVEYNGEAVQNEGTVTFTHYIRLVQTGLSRLTTTEAEDILSVAGIPDEDCNRCGNGYPGADQVLVFGAGVTGAADANVLYTENGGGTIAAMSPDPWAGLGSEENTFIAIRPITTNQVRVIVGTGTAVVGSKARIAYADLTYGALGTPTWTITTITATTVDTATIQAMAWLTFDRLYIASEGDIYLSTDQGTTDPGAAIYTGATAINGFAKAPDDSEVWAFGASNLILRELDQSGLFVTRVGPAGGGAFTALAIAGDGTLYAGNATSIYRSTDKANVAGNWTELYDFGADKAVRKIACLGGDRAFGGDSQLLYAVVDDTTGAAAGAVWRTVDGGATWQPITTLTNLGYNDAYFSKINDNYGVIVGDASGGTGVIHYLGPQ